MKLISRIAMLYCSCALSACLTDKVEIELLSITIEPGPYEITIPARGELQAVTSTSISIPATVRGSRTIAWLQSENSPVRQGDVLVKFDDTDQRRWVEEEQYAIDLIELDIREKKLDIALSKKELIENVALVKLERDLTVSFAPRDERLFSRNEIIEATMNIDYLNENLEHLQKQLAQFEEKTNAELEVLQLRRQTSRVKLDQHNESLQLNEIKAPHEGIFVYEHNWRGEKPRAGQNVWGGMVLGHLPDLSRMEVKAYVQEAEAGGLIEGLEARIVLEAAPQKEYRGTVLRVDKLAKRLDQEKPVNYFETIISLDTTEPEYMKPGGQVWVTIFVEKRDRVIALPNQVLFSQGETTFVYRRQGDTFVKNEVKTGVRSVSRTIITQGLEAGDQVALSQPRTEE
ncbi:HlyD family efflux transporter periplasmic adaptor subunit [bacterium]|nr:HlyD family efflux transporter periplasmic adaptor subunit [bacterium]